MTPDTLYVEQNGAQQAFAISAARLAILATQLHLTAAFIEDLRKCNADDAAFEDALAGIDNALIDAGMK